MTVGWTTEETHTLWKQGPRGLFEDRTVSAGITSHATGFGTFMGDFDHDGALDLTVVNGRVRRPESRPEAAADRFWSLYGDQNQLLANTGTGQFRDISLQNAPFCGRSAVSRGLACGDIDGDGALDFLVTEIAGPARIYRTVAPKQGHWLLIRAIDPALRRDAYGAELTVNAGGRSWLSQINPGSSYLCSNDSRAHFGLGQIHQAGSIHVIWPDGAEEDFPGGAVDRMITLRKGRS